MKQFHVRLPRGELNDLDGPVELQADDAPVLPVALDEMYDLLDHALTGTVVAVVDGD